MGRTCCNPCCGRHPLGWCIHKAQYDGAVSGAAFEFELYLSYDKFNQVYRLAFLDDLNGYLDIYTGQMQDGILKVDNRNRGTAFPDGTGGHVVGVLEFKPTTGGGFSLFAQTGSHATADLQPYMRVEFKAAGN